ncbi:hypothetical protein [Novipirellula artificiosorum]|uniref:Bacterial Pleckstrin homology domain-containing protein n=1 Tax=Novipirellula artificiosorum TaxID=2528016 RepID=A0A5C6E0G1_9BACT|nr:hypothetical protein [Novipirellula artificiosorum]TWU40639.1 hypothetical protein Poly41_14730 [Novipirellula artificiosorum]
MNGTYNHTQRSPLCLLLYALGFMFLILSWVLRNEPVIEGMFLFIGVLMLFLAASFHHLKVEDEGDQLGIRFGPIPLFRRTVFYSEIESVAVGRTTILDGWGIHLSLRGGWVWNLWGRDCVVLKLHKSILHVGTDDPVHLADFVKSRLEGLNRNEHNSERQQS